MRKLLTLLLACFLPACGTSDAPEADALLSLFTPENAYSVIQDPNNIVSIVDPSNAMTPAEFAEMVESGEYELVTEAGIKAAAENAADQAALDRAEALVVFDGDPDSENLVNPAIDPNDPRFRPLADGNVLFRAVEADPNQGLPEQWFPLGGSHVMDPGLLDAQKRQPTLENQREMYAGFYENLPAAYIADQFLPKPEDVQQEDVSFFVNLNLQIADDWRLFIPQSGPSQPPAGYPASWRDEEGAGTPLQPALGLDRFGPQELPQGLWSQVDFPLKWCATRVRSQGTRWLCAYFSVTGAVEARFAAKRGRWVNLSEQYLYNQNKRVWNYDTDHGEAGWPSAALWRMNANAFVFPYERVWDYNQSLFRNNNLVDRYYTQSCWANATGTALYAGLYCSDTNHQSPGICAMRDGRMFCATIDVGPRIRTRTSGITARRWFTVSGPDTAPNHTLAKLCLALKIPICFCHGVPSAGFTGANGFCTIPTPEPSVSGAHCVVLLGYIANADLPADVPPGDGGGYYIGKNSWGTTWGDRGYFYASDAWIDKYCAGMYAVSQVTG